MATSGRAEQNHELTANPALLSAVRTIETERAGLEALAQALSCDLGTAFVASVELIARLKGRVILTGMLKICRQDRDQDSRQQACPRRRRCRRPGIL